MQTVKCKKHKIEFQLPTVEEEYVSGSFHDDIELLCSHHERYPKCRKLKFYFVFFTLNSLHDMIRVNIEFNVA